MALPASYQGVPGAVQESVDELLTVRQLDGCGSIGVFEMVYLHLRQLTGPLARLDHGLSLGSNRTLRSGDVLSSLVDVSAGCRQIGYG